MQFGILGPLHVTDGSRPVTLTARNPRVLLAVLLCHPNQPVSTEKLIDAIWEQLPPRTAVKNLQGYVLQLRQALGRARVVRHPHGYALKVGHGELDAENFQHDLQQARRTLAAGDLRQTRQLLTQALAGWRGPVLADLASVTALRETVTTLTQQHIGAWEDRVDVDLALGAHASIVVELTAQVMEHPLRERMRGQLMLALNRSGRQAEALQCYEEGRTILGEELGIEPTDALRRIHLDILRGTDTGPQLDQATQASGGVGQPPAIAPAQLPADVSAFTGRAHELAELDRLCSLTETQSTTVIVSAIAGMAGVGKTALALRWAHQARSRFPDGQLYVNLRGHSSAPPLRPIEALSRFLHALGVAPAHVPLDADEAAALYRSMLTDRRIVVILDNARDAAQVRALLPGSPGCLVLVTSRNALSGLTARDGAHAVRLGVLSRDEAGSLLEQLLGADRAAREPEAVYDLARLCAYLPLALRIAAANMAGRSDLTIADQVRRLGTHGLGALSVYGDDEAAVRTAFDLSLTALSTRQRHLFCLLSLVPGADFTVGAAAALIEAPEHDAAALLEGLVNAHLVERHPNGRFTLHDLLRQYGLEQADRESAAAAAVNRLFAFYLAHVQSATRMLFPGVVQLPDTAALPSAAPFATDALAAAWLDDERPALVAAAVHAGEHRLWPAAWQLADALRAYFQHRSHLTDWTAVATAALSATQQAGDPVAEAGIRLGLGVLLWRQSNHLDAWRHLRRAAELAEESGWQEGEAAIVNNLGVGSLDAGKLQAAAEQFSRAHKLNSNIGNRAMLAVNRVNLAQVSLISGDLDAAEQQALDSLALYTESNSSSGRSEALMRAGEAQYLSGRFDDAIANLTASVDISMSLADSGNQIPAMCALAAALAAFGEATRAQDLADAASDLARSVGEPRQEVIIGYTHALIRHYVGDVEAAVRGHRQALAQARDLPERYITTRILLGLAAACRDLGANEAAMASAAEALAMAQEHGYQFLSAQAAALTAEIPQPPDL
ncbi:AfsR/SARP family transcriptional regulator [Catellatospora sp. KI3]|uniref:AfsR/SARP family transcriptional regulator n=1 Tax=Catellatospora sp. KI3 TaxID=3041620 RepID=UPI002482AE1E|nr:AfsR/SARP family transcriptional regulator [Catellatospora sp. KI3]MDI1463390.1 AfsR/SARP family transcriptional regulator [Catellatospora sp. KI3]